MQVRCEDGKFDISLDSKEQLIKVGMSKDLGFCKGRKKVTWEPASCIQKAKISPCTSRFRVSSIHSEQSGRP